MIFLNKYLKEIGIDENYWLFTDRKVDKRALPDEEGFVLSEFFSLDVSLAIYIYSHLCYFKEHCLHGVPSCFLYDKNGNHIDFEIGKKKWTKKIDEMIDGFKMVIASDEYIEKYINEPDYDKRKIKQNKIIEKGLKVFIKYYFNLWY